MSDTGQDETDNDTVEEPEPISRKEAARLMRKKAYQAAKERRDSDPKYIEMKERAKDQRKAAYQRQKEYMKAKKAAAKEKNSN